MPAKKKGGGKKGRKGPWSTAPWTGKRTGKVGIKGF
jgi:hypothetical protein